jgi:hypothetical protein
MKSNVPLTAGFGNKVFVHGRGWIKRDELHEPVKDLELTRLMELEKKVTVNFIEAAEALREIKEKKLYLRVAETWEQYCNERLGRSVRAVRDQLKTLEISEELAQPNKIGTHVPKPPLPLKDLRKLARPPAKKIVAETPLDTEPEEEDLFDEIITRIRRAKSNQHFLKALKEWLDESGM